MEENARELESANKSPTQPPDNNQPDNGKSVVIPVAQETKAEITIETRIEQLRSSMKEAKEGFNENGKKIKRQVWIWAGINILLIGCSVLFACYLLDHKNNLLDENWSWKIIYYAVVRITMIAAIFSLITYTLKLLSSHIRMLHHNSHKVAVLSALPGFVESGSDPVKREIIYDKLVELVILFDDSGMTSKDAEFKSIYDVLIKLSEQLSKINKQSLEVGK